MIEQVVVAYQVHTAMVEQHVDMFVELLTDHEAMMQSLQQFVLLICENARIGRIDGWKMATTQRVDLPFKHDRAMFIIDEIEKLAILHLPFWVFLIELRFQFKLHYSDCLMHLGREPYGLLIEVLGITREDGAELCAGIIGVSVHGKGGQWYHINTIAFLECSEIGVSQ